MKRVEFQCCLCASPGYPCRGESCPRRHVEVYYCDECGEEIDGDVYEDGDDLCEYCLLKRYRKEI